MRLGLMNLISGTQERKRQDIEQIKYIIDLSTVCREAGYLWRKGVGGRDEFHVRGTLMGGFNDLLVPTL